MCGSLGAFRGPRNLIAVGGRTFGTRLALIPLSSNSQPFRTPLLNDDPPFLDDILAEGSTLGSRTLLPALFRM